MSLLCFHCIAKEKKFHYAESDDSDQTVQMQSFSFLFFFIGEWVFTDRPIYEIILHRCQQRNIIVTLDMKTKLYEGKTSVTRQHRLLEVPKEER